MFYFVRVQCPEYLQTLILQYEISAAPKFNSRPKTPKPHKPHLAACEIRTWLWASYSGPYVEPYL